jgi:hypothetical protein
LLIGGAEVYTQRNMSNGGTWHACTVWVKVQMGAYMHAHVEVTVDEEIVFAVGVLSYHVLLFSVFVFILQGTVGERTEYISVCVCACVCVCVCV